MTAKQLTAISFFLSFAPAGCKSVDIKGESQIREEKHQNDDSDVGADASHLKRFLYVANDSTAKVDVFDINDNHKLVRSFKADLDTGNDGMRYRGITAHAGTARLYLSDSDTGKVGAYDLKTDQLVWVKTYDECTFPDRINVNKAGTALFIPCKKDPNQHIVVDASTGEFRQKYAMDRYPHNTFTGEQGKYMYLSGYRNPDLLVVDQESHELVRKVTGFKNSEGEGVRPFSVDKEERFAFATENDQLGFGVGDIKAGKQIFYVKQETPSERTQHDDAECERPHGGEPPSHGLAVRPGAREVWFIDDAWGYLYVYDTTPLYQNPPKIPVHKANVELFEAIDKKWTKTRWRWVAMSLEGDYVYPASGIVVDGETKKRLPYKITPSEKLIEIQFSGNTPVRVSGQNGGAYE
ncbi:MAG: YncE family protein [Oligoflexales bacterium]